MGANVDELYYTSAEVTLKAALQLSVEDWRTIYFRYFKMGIIPLSKDLRILPQMNQHKRILRKQEAFLVKDLERRVSKLEDKPLQAIMHIQSYMLHNYGTVVRLNKYKLKEYLSRRDLSILLKCKSNT